MTDDSYQLTDAERSALVLAALTTIAGHKWMAPENHPLVSALIKITGTDTVLVARRAYPPPSPSIVIPLRERTPKCP